MAMVVDTLSAEVDKAEEVISSEQYTTKPIGK
jgi:hypothetical protein